MKRRHLVIIFVLFAGLISLPYLLAWGMAGNEHVFAGMLANPVDGQSYLTKMRLGWNGQILFQLTYSPQNGEAHPLFLFYTILGWLSHQLNIPLIISFHLARLISAAFLFVTLVTLVQKTISRPYQVKTLLLLVIGSGMGWLVLPFSGSGLPIDFYVAETYPFLSSYSNPHFPLGTALLLWILMESLEYRGTKETILIFVLGLLLSIIVPFGVVLALTVYGGVILWAWINKRKVALIPVFALLAGGGVFLLYQFYIIKTDPLLALWDAQNITAAPDPLLLLVGLLPAFIPAVAAVRLFYKRELSDDQNMLFVWVIAGLILTYIPFNLQRRFLTALYIPLTLCAVFALEKFNLQQNLKKRILTVVLMLAIISNGLILAMELAACSQKDPNLYLTQSQAAALNWLQENGPTDSVVLTSADMGLFVPAISGKRVVYGHPFESINADRQKMRVEAFFDGKMKTTEMEAFLKENRVSYIMFEINDGTIISTWDDGKLNKVYEQDGIRIFEVK